MKCARCAHQWKLVPEDAMPDEDVLLDEETADNAVPAQAEHQWQDQSEASGVDYDDSAPFQAEDASAYEDHTGTSMDEEQWTPLQADEYEQMDQHASAAYNDPVAETPQPPIAEDGNAPSQGRRARGQRGHPPAGPDAGSGRAYPIPSDAYDVPSGIFEDETAPHEGVAPPHQPEAEETSAVVQDENWSSRFMGPGWRGRKAAPPIEEEEDEDPESVIRETFRSVLERPDEEEHAAAADLAEQAESQNPYGSIYDAEWNRSGDEDDEIPFAASAQSGAGIGDQDYYAAEEAIEEATSAYMRNEYGVGDPDAEEINHPDLQHYDSEDLADPDALDRFVPQDGRSQPYNANHGEIEGYDDEPNEFVTSQPSEDYAALYGDQFDDAVDHFAGENSFDETLAGLHDDARQNDLNDSYIAEHQNRSGLAVAAGWVAFLSLMGGLLLGLVNFRQDVMTALPGTVNMYRMLGYEVELNKVDFASVDYNWSKIDGRPAIELRGEVVNITDKTVKVPPVMVNVQSTSGTALKAEASVPTDELGPRDSATFTLELVSPPEDISRIELEFAPKG